MKRLNVAVAGLGYVGMSLAVLLARKHSVIAFDIDPDRIAKVNAGQSTVADQEIDKALATEDLSLTGTLDPEAAFSGADFIIVAAPTNYDEQAHFFDTSAVEDVIRTARVHNKSALIVIKSTIPVGFTAQQRAVLMDDGIAFSPEFLREGKALYDNYYPSRIIVGAKGDSAAQFAEMLKDASLKPEVEILLTGSDEAEAIKLFANTYLATRVAFFNELDSFGLAQGLNVSELINGVCLDPRVGTGYNNPSFGYGGYCLPKDTKQLLANYKDVPHQLVQAVVDANSSRKKFIAEQIVKTGAKTLGVYRLTMKQGSDNMRSSAMYDVVKYLLAEGAHVIVYEPMLPDDNLKGAEIVESLDEFLHRSDQVICNRKDAVIQAFSGPIFTRDIFGVD
ncbi:UDP-glucose dehydrogenase [Shimia gijangensis]|uniref:UDP-glucose 6-dehydrogenase n=2 Tax=Shimia gijangensis TaxID=1470563 RepID=A0A1M6DA85_9RHOB|nr:UDP-glucose dehydrogenase [Shimia gijangensis]